MKEEERYAFWLSFCRLAGCRGLDWGEEVGLGVGKFPRAEVNQFLAALFHQPFGG